jgi:hypothetical protein
VDLLASLSVDAKTVLVRGVASRAVLSMDTFELRVKEVLDDAARVQAQRWSVVKGAWIGAVVRATRWRALARSGVKGTL